MSRDANLSPVDRVIRIAAGEALFTIGLFAVRGVPGIALGAIGAVLVFSGAVGFCHVYKVCGISTAKKA